LKKEVVNEEGRGSKEEEGDRKKNVGGILAGRSQKRGSKGKRETVRITEPVRKRNLKGAWQELRKE